jgi:two-component system, chemotaxis family, CheB/CheR fusion protein
MAEKDEKATEPEISPTEEVTSDPEPLPQSAGFPIVGLGASAGGLEALETFFDEMPPDSGIAFVIITHQAPTRVSLMPDLLRNHTSMPLRAVTAGMPVEPNHIYLPPPGMHLAILNAVLQPMSADVTHGGLQFPIDYFFRALADDQRDKAICIVLSGTGTDGTIGVKAVKGAGGLVIVQEEQSAKFAGMPASAVATGVVDYVLPPAHMPRRLLSFVRGPYLQPAVTPSPVVTLTPDLFRQIYVLLRNRTRQDFSAYKTSTLQRRIERRMNVHQIQSADQYVRFLREHPYEMDLLLQELLIGVTNFFRDPEAFDFLEHTAIPELLATRPDDLPIRVWVPGCSTGEEVYSLAIILHEAVVRLQKSCAVQIFATDLNPQSIAKARSGHYPGGITVDVSPERLERFFVKENGSFHIKKEVRDLVVFAEQNVLTDPPFTKLELLSCRNLMIYLNPQRQRQLIPLFHYALNPGGLLFLGSSETIGGYTDLFTTLENRWKIFKRKVSGTNAPLMMEFPVRIARPGGAPVAAGSLTRTSDPTLVSLVEKVLVQQFSPPSVIVDDCGDIVYIHGLTGHFLQPAPGLPTHNVFTMAREGLRMDLLDAVREAAAQDHSIIYKKVQVRTNGGTENVDVAVRKITEPEALRGLVLVSFLESAQPPPRRRGGRAKQIGAVEQERIIELEREVQMLRNTLQSTIEEGNTTHEELKSTNEELQSTNEELQSANEELETAKEEMQSLNEELQTLNGELQSKVEQLSRVNDDLQNLLNSTDIATLFLDNQLRIKRFTPPTKQVFKLLPGDVGRSIGDIMSTLKYDKLDEDAREVMQTLAVKEIEVATQDDKWYALRMLPYRTSENVIDGLVITFVDITKQKQMDQEQRIDARQYAEHLGDLVREALVVLGTDLTVVAANRAFYRMFRLSPEKVLNRHLFELSNGHWDVPRLRQMVEEFGEQHPIIGDRKVEIPVPGGPAREYLLNAQRVERLGDLPSLILLTLEESSPKTG